MAHSVALPEGITIRRLRPDDLDLLCGQSHGLFDDAVRPDAARAFLADPGHWMIAALDGQNMVSFASATVLRHPDKMPALFVNEVGTRDAWQRKGLALAVMRTLLSEAESAGIVGVWLATEPDNAPARALYRKLRADEMPVVGFGWNGAFDLEQGG